jgi:hypothetical protein
MVPWTGAILILIVAIFRRDRARRRALRAALWAYAGLLAVAAIAIGEHYLIDLLAAIPFALGVQWTAQWLGRIHAARSDGWKPALAPTISSGEGGF